MSLLFSTVTIAPQQGASVTIWESGHPDEYDLRELLRYEARYTPFRKMEYHGAVVQVHQYRFSSMGRDWLAEQDSLALIAAYDELALRYCDRYTAGQQRTWHGLQFESLLPERLPHLGTGRR